MAVSELAEIQQKLRESRRKTMSLLHTIDGDRAAHRVRPDAWSIKDHVAHLVAVEEAVVEFACRILHEECPVSPFMADLNFDQDAWNDQAIAEKAALSWAEVVSELEEMHDELIIFINELPPNAATRIGSHPVWGDPVTLASVLRVPYRHERGHQNEIAALVASYV